MSVGAEAGKETERFQGSGKTVVPKAKKPCKTMKKKARKVKAKTKGSSKTGKGKKVKKKVKGAKKAAAKPTRRKAPKRSKAVQICSFLNYII